MRLVTAIDSVWEITVVDSQSKTLAVDLEPTARAGSRDRAEEEPDLFRMCGYESFA